MCKYILLFVLISFSAYSGEYKSTKKINLYVEQYYKVKLQDLSQNEQIRIIKYLTKTDKVISKIKKEHGVNVSYVLNGDYDKSYRPVDVEHALWLSKVILRWLNFEVIPKKLFKKTVKNIYLVSIKGDKNNRHMCISSKPAKKYNMYLTTISRIYGEFARLLLIKYKSKFDKDKWNYLNPDGFVYKKRKRGKITAKTVHYLSYFLDEKSFESLEYDFSSLCDQIFTQGMVKFKLKSTKDLADDGHFRYFVESRGGILQKFKYISEFLKSVGFKEFDDLFNVNDLELHYVDYMKHSRKSKSKSKDIYNYVVRFQDKVIPIKINTLEDYKKK